MIKKILAAGLTAATLGLGLAAATPAQADVNIYQQHWHRNVPVHGNAWYWRHHKHGPRCEMHRGWRHGHRVWVRVCHRGW